MRSQALGLAEAIGLPFAEKRIAVPPSRWGFLRQLVPATPGALHASGDPLMPPWPRLLIACGRRSAGPAIAVRRAAEGATRVVYIQDPHLSPRYFDLVVPMRHDRLRGRNVLPVDTALHRIRPEVLAAAAEWGGRLRRDAALLIGVLIGGSTRRRPMLPAQTAKIADLLRTLHARSGARVVLTPSRRTDAKVSASLRAALGGAEWYAQWSGEEPNPYHAILAGSDRLLVTADSVSMVSEALATGKPVHVLSGPRPSRRHAAFLEALRSRGAVSVVDGPDLDWTFTGAGRIDATPAVAAEVVRRLLKPLA